MDQINQPNGIRDLSSNFRSTAPPFTMKNTEQLNNMSKEQYIPSRRMSPEKVKISIKWSWKSKLFFGFLIVLMASLTAVTIYMYVRPLNGMNSSPLSSTSPKPQELIIYTKEDWGGKPWDSNECCSQNMRIIQEYHMNNNWGDVGYNFVVCNDGNVYEGVGWDVVGSHTKGQNRYSQGISFNGNFNIELPNELQLRAFNLLMDEGVRLGKLKSDFRVFAHRQFSSTNSPGEAFYELIKTWDRWSDEI